MDVNWKLRLGAGLISICAMIYYFYQIYDHVDTWQTRKEIQKDTQCDTVYTIQVWTLTQSFIWCISLMIVLTIVINPDFYKLMLFFMYFVGPIHLLWTSSTVIYFLDFFYCCKKALDGCQDFYAYQHYPSVAILLGFSFVFSLIVTVALLRVLCEETWSVLRGRACGYLDVIGCQKWNF